MPVFSGLAVLLLRQKSDVCCMVCAGQKVDGVYTRDPTRLEAALEKGTTYFDSMPKAAQDAHLFLFSCASGVSTL